MIISTKSSEKAKIGPDANYDPDRILNYCANLDHQVRIILHSVIISDERKNLDQEIHSLRGFKNKKIVEILELAKKSLQELDKSIEKEFIHSQDIYDYFQKVNKEKTKEQAILENYTFVMKMSQDIRTALKEFLNNYELYFTTLHKDYNYEYPYTKSFKKNISGVWDFLLNTKF